MITSDTVPKDSHRFYGGDQKNDDARQKTNHTICGSRLPLVKNHVGGNPTL